MPPAFAFDRTRRPVPRTAVWLWLTSPPPPGSTERPALIVDFTRNPARTPVWLWLVVGIQPALSLVLIRIVVTPFDRHFFRGAHRRSYLRAPTSRQIDQRLPKFE